MSFYYKLDEDQRPVPVPDGGFSEYYSWHDSMPPSSSWYTKKTGVGFQIAGDEAGDVWVSTVYLGMNHGYGEGHPILWETMAFADGWGGDYQVRYSSHAEAVEGHKKICRLIASEGFEALVNRSKE